MYIKQSMKNHKWKYKNNNASKKSENQYNYIVTITKLNAKSDTHLRQGFCSYDAETTIHVLGVISSAHAHVELLGQRTLHSHFDFINKQWLVWGRKAIDQ